MSTPTPPPGPTGPPPAGPPPYPPPGGPTGPPPSRAKSGKGKTIGLIVVGVVLVGTIGGLVGAALGGSESTDLTNDEPTQGPSASASPSAPVTGGILDPTPVGSPSVPTEGPTDEPTDGPTGEPTSEPTSEPTLDPTDDPTTLPTDGFTTAPTDEPSLPTALPTPTPTPPPTAADTVPILGGQVQVALPAGWKIFNQGDSAATVTNEKGSYVYVLAGTGVDPATDAASLINQNVKGVLPPEQYSGLKFGKITPLDPQGSVTSIAQVEYGGLWVDPQSPIPFHGLFFALVRSDGTAMILTAEHAPPSEFEDSIDELGEVAQPTLAMFAGL